MGTSVALAGKRGQAVGMSHRKGARHCRSRYKKRRSWERSLCGYQSQVMAFSMSSTLMALPSWSSSMATKSMRHKEGRSLWLPASRWEVRA